MKETFGQNQAESQTQPAGSDVFGAHLFCICHRRSLAF